MSSSTDTEAELLSPLRALLSTKNEYVWSIEHDQTLSNAKAHLTGAPTQAFFDAERITRLCIDASQQGVGFILQQQSSAGKWLLIQAGSRFLTPTETWYGTIELELLAVAWSVANCPCWGYKTLPL